MAPRKENTAQRKRREEAEAREKEKQIIARQQRELDKLQEQLKAQGSELESLSKKSRKSSGGSVFVLPLNKTLQDTVTKMSGRKGQVLWRTTKFLANDDQLKVVAQQVMLLIPETKALLQGKDGVDLDNTIGAFLKIYGGTLCTAINDSRSDTQSGMKTAYLERFSTGAPMPTPPQLLKVILRKGMDFPTKPKDIGTVDDYDDEDAFKEAQEEFKTAMAAYELKLATVKRNRDWFKWYWTHLLSKVAGNKRWSQGIRNWGLISTHGPPDSPGKKYITSSDEALVAVLYENCGQRFPYLASIGSQKHDRFHPQYQSAYSSSESGSQKFGGWSLEGRERYAKILTAVRKAKKNGAAIPLEKSILEEIQVDLGLKDKLEDKKRKGRVPLDFEDDERGHAPVGVESDAMSELEDEDDFDSQAFTPKYRAPPKKKTTTNPKKAKNPPKKKAKTGDEESGDGDDSDTTTGE